jgi:membrane peptidoglycan carboxypeptidase
MTSMMADVVSRGTASTARTSGFKFAAAGKTGTSQSYADAWFVGYTPQLVTGVWFGFDQPQTIMNRGYASVVAVPAWAKFMAAAHDGQKSDWFAMPASLTKVRLCRLSGQLATDRCHLPVIEPPAFDPDNPLQPMTTTVREGGVYEDLRPVSRTPEPCPLPHTDALPMHADFDPETITRDWRVMSDTTAPAVAVPPSMRPAPPAPVLTLDPGSSVLRPVSDAPPTSAAGAVTRPPGY